MFSILPSVVLMTAVWAEPGAAPSPFARRPDIHGNTLVFVHAGDIWRKDLASDGPATRVLTTPYVENEPRLSPDGQSTAFEGAFDGGRSVYVIPLTGGEPVRVTYGSADRLLGWLNDGRVLYSAQGSSPWPDGRSVWAVPSTDGVPEQFAVFEMGAASAQAETSRLLYNRFVPTAETLTRWRGGQMCRVGQIDPSTGESRWLTSPDHQAQYPTTVAGQIVCLSDRDSPVLNVVALQNDVETPITAFTQFGVRSLRSDASRAVFERDGELYVWKPGSEPTQVALTLDSAVAPTMTKDVKLAEWASDLVLSPDGTRAAVVSRGDLWVVDIATAGARHIVNTPATREAIPAWSPDGSRLAWFASEGGRPLLRTRVVSGDERAAEVELPKEPSAILWHPSGDRLFVLLDRVGLFAYEPASGQLRKITTFDRWIGGFSLSSDGSWFAVCDARATGLKRLRLVNTATGDSHDVTDPAFEDTDCAFDHAGNYLYFVSRRNAVVGRGEYENSMALGGGLRLLAIALSPGVPPPGATFERGSTAIMIDGVRDRTYLLPVPANEFKDLRGSRGMLSFAANGGVFRFALGTEKPLPDHPDARGLVSSDPDLRLQAAMDYGALTLSDADGRVRGKADLSGVSWSVDLRQEWGGIAWDAWGFLSHRFYDPTFRGMDWDAIGHHYAGQVSRIGSRAELNAIIARMMGESNGSHNAIFEPGDIRVRPASPAPASLGLLLSWDGHGARINDVIHGRKDIEYFGSLVSPMDVLGDAVRVGEYVVAIDGTAVAPSTNPLRLLLGKAGKDVLVEVNATPARAGARRYTVRAIGSDGGLLYRRFLERSQSYVDRVGAGRIGYVHVFDTNSQGINAFANAFFSQNDREAFIVDARWNRGGSAQSGIVPALLRTPYLVESKRDGKPTLDTIAIPGPKVLLINEYAGSGGDLLAYEFRARQAGTLVGARTAGRTIGWQWSLGLVDGGQIACSESLHTDARTGADVGENAGIGPDVPVEADPAMVAQGRDPQLEEAVRQLLQRLGPAVAKPGRVP
ncbi:S41 family peptidase [soil metagenome]